jgi:hypothetical protein
MCSWIDQDDWSIKRSRCSNFRYSPGSRPIGRSEAAKVPIHGRNPVLLGSQPKQGEFFSLPLANAEAGVGKNFMSNS